MNPKIKYCIILLLLFKNLLSRETWDISKVNISKNVKIKIKPKKISNVVTYTTSLFVFYFDKSEIPVINWVYYEMGLLEKAIKDLKFAAALNWDYLFALGIVQEEAKLYNEALQSYSQYLEHYPTEVDCKSKLDSLKVKMSK